MSDVLFFMARVTVSVMPKYDFLEQDAAAAAARFTNILN